MLWFITLPYGAYPKQKRNFDRSLRISCKLQYFIIFGQKISRPSNSCFLKNAPKWAYCPFSNTNVQNIDDTGCMRIKKNYTYRWTKMVGIAAGRKYGLVLTSGNNFVCSLEDGRKSSSVKCFEHTRWCVSFLSGVRTGIVGCFILTSQRFSTAGSFGNLKYDIPVQPFFAPEPIRELAEQQPGTQHHTISKASSLSCIKFRRIEYCTIYDVSWRRSNTNPRNCTQIRAIFSWIVSGLADD